ncbi:MAG: type II toxin-antitoxin system VapC family toxin [Deltaproteobacteria bacterium]|nr:type II toxin-antitoxin system VapC family toxin [Deltaproteobacteria bacterium]
MKILFDTDVLIEYLRGNETVLKGMRNLVEGEHILAFTPITSAEIYRGARSNEKSKTEALLGSLECLELDAKVGKRAGEYLRSYSRSHGVELVDALIAAAAHVHKFSLCTFNWKHYPMSEIERYSLL